jgi:hypothetical protein
MHILIAVGQYYDRYIGYLPQYQFLYFVLLEKLIFAQQVKKFPASRKIKFYFCVYNSGQPIANLSKLKPVCTLTSRFYRINSNLLNTSGNYS